MKTLNKILEDEIIIKIYNNIEKNENEHRWWAHHDLTHVKNVSKMVEKILRIFNYDEKFIEEAKIAAILHDIGSINGKEKHAIKSYEFVKEYIYKNKIRLQNEDKVLEAIKLHSDGFETNNVIASVLILCDKLDIKSTRLTEEGKKIKGIRQWEYIKDIVLTIDNDILEIRFICAKGLNQKELEEFYFTDKLIKAIKCFEKNMKIFTRVYFNNKEWKILN